VAVIWHNPTALCGSRPAAGYAGFPAVPLWPTGYGRWPRRVPGKNFLGPLVAAPLGPACFPAVLAPPDPHARGDPTLASGLVRVGWATTSSLPGISVWQGRRLPKVETRFAWTHPATSLSSLACWRPRSRRTSTFQGQLFSPPKSILRQLRPKDMPTACTAGRATDRRRSGLAISTAASSSFRSFHRRASWRT
jgi:hypothetical protein